MLEPPPPFDRAGPRDAIEERIHGAKRGELRKERAGCRVEEGWRVVRSAGRYSGGRTAERDEVAALPVADRYAVFSMRVRVEPRTLRTITPRDFAKLAINEGWIETEIMAAAMVESVALLPEGPSQPTGAEITVSLGGRTNPSTFPMVYEDGAWLVDLATQMQRGAASAETMAEVLGEDADEMMAVALSAKAGKAEIVDVYAPIGRE